MSETDPKGALVRLEKLRDRINDSEVDPSSKKQLLTLVDRSVDSLQQYIELNKSDIELTERNREIVQGLQLDSQRKLEIQNKLASLVEEFNQLLDEQRYAEAERIAKQAKELDPEAEVVQNLLWQSRFVRRMQEQMAINETEGTGVLRRDDRGRWNLRRSDERSTSRTSSATAKDWRQITRRTPLAARTTTSTPDQGGNGNPEGHEQQGRREIQRTTALGSHGYVERVVGSADRARSGRDGGRRCDQRHAGDHSAEPADLAAGVP